MTKKKIWVVKSGEPLMFDSKHERLLRSSTLAHNLPGNNYEVTYFVDSFNHLKKQFRKIKLSEFESVSYKFLNGIGYVKNTSVRRIIHNILISFNFIFKAFKYKPDLVIVSYPPILLAFSVAIFCYFKKIKYIVDFRDAWPDIFTKNTFFKSMLFFLLYPIINFTIRNSFKLTGCAPFFKDFITKYSNTFQSKKYTYIPHTYFSNSDIENKLKSSVKNDNKINLIYLGVLSNQRRIGEFIDFYKSYNDNLKMNLFICGNGDLLEDLKNKYESENVFFSGYIDLITMDSYSIDANVGIAPYELNEGFVTNVPNKIIEYLYYGLPIITNLRSNIISNLNQNSSSTVVYNYSNCQDLHEHFDVILNNKNNLTVRKKLEIRKIFKKKFGPDIFIKKFEKLF
jgi:hypothetical protein